MEDTTGLAEKRSELKRKLIHLEWDARLKQINFARKMELDAYRKELDALEEKMALEGKQ